MLKYLPYYLQYEPLIQRGNEGFVHHMLLYECVEAPESTILFESYVSHRGTACYGPNMPAIWEKCLTPVLAWAIGSQGEMFPSHVGLPLAEDHRSTFFMLETHYDNPMFRSAVDSSGVRVFYSNKLREYDGGMLVSGITVTPLHVIPPRQPQYHTVGYCNSLCTQRMFPQTGIKVVSVLLHSHLAGRKMKLRHIRDKQELSLIAKDDNYDFNYQQSRTLQTEVLVLPGDELITECAYQTLNRTDPTLGGYSTRQEMCLAFLLYYPRTSMASCLSMTPVKYFFETFGVKKFYNITMDAVERMFLKLGPSDNEQLNEQVRLLTYSTSTTSTSPSFPVRGDDMDQDVNNRAIYTLQQMKDFSEDQGPGVGGGSLLAQLVIKEPKEFCDKTFMSHLHELPWEEQLLTQRIEDTLMRGQHMVFCRRWDDELVIPAMFSMFPNITKSQDMTSCQSCCKDRSQQGNTATQLATLSSLTVLLYCCILLLQSRRDCYSP
uniref:Uncharacterized protein n=1 Tax=Timema cristinae TaxID=61476 RepID=A0A7R9HBE5_TIMCR|nr:unnamed protein product [Timema cristinae]